MRPKPRVRSFNLASGDEARLDRRSGRSGGTARRRHGDERERRRLGRVDLPSRRRPSALDRLSGPTSARTSCRGHL